MPTQEEIAAKIMSEFFGLLKESIEAQKTANKLKSLEIHLMEVAHNAKAITGEYVDGFGKAAEDIIEGK